MKLKIQIPDYFNVKHYKMLTHLSSLDEREQMIAVITALTGTDEDEIMKWNISSVVAVYNELQAVMSSIKPEFYPIIEWGGKQYGFSSMAKMSLGEYVDLDNLTKDVEGNINQILALLYRPIVKNKVAGTYMVKSTLKAMKYEVENIFDYYEIEEYDPVTRKTVADSFNEFPAEIALGAMSFFLGLKVTLSSGSQIYSQQLDKIKKEMSKMKKKERVLVNTTAGYLHSKNWATPRSYPLPEINQLLT